MEERTPAEVVEYAREQGVEIVDLRFMDLPGLMQHFSIPVKELTEDVMRGVVSLPHGYGHKRAGVRAAVAVEHAGVSLNDLTDDQAVDALSGNAAFSGVPVTVVSAPG